MVDRSVDLHPITFNFIKNEVSIGESFQSGLNINIDEFRLISNIIFTYGKSSKGETKKEQILEIVKIVGDSLTRASGGRPTKLYQYLNNEINDYSIDKATSVVMKNFVAFVFNPDSIEKLESFLMNKTIEGRWIAYAFWCAFNGFANISRNFVKPVFDTDNHELQDYLDSYMHRTFSSVDINSVDFNTLKIKNQNIELPKTAAGTGTPETILPDKNLQFFHDFIEGKYELTIDQFEETMRNNSKEVIVNELKNKFKIKKMESKKIVNAYNELVHSGTLF